MTRFRPFLVAVLLTLPAVPVPAAVVDGPGQVERKLAQDVYDRIAQAWGGPTASLTVAVEDGLVVLDGEAPTPQDVREATDVAEATPGVTEVLNRLQPRKQ